MNAADKLQEVAALLTSPINGQDYSITHGTLLVRRLVAMQAEALLLTDPAKHHELELAKLDALKSKNVQALLDNAKAVVVSAQDAQLKAEKELPISQSSRHMLTDVLQALDPEAHAQYRAVKYADPSGKATPENRYTATVNAFVRLIELTFVPGIY